jgi:hypothetical protein
VIIKGVTVGGTDPGEEVDHKPGRSELYRFGGGDWYESCEDLDSEGRVVYRPRKIDWSWLVSLMGCRR